MIREGRPSDIVLVRHGESIWNAWGRDRKKEGDVPPEMKGVPDHLTPITQEGLRQAQVTGRALAQEFGEVAVVYHSPHVRTTQSARAITEAFPIRPLIYRDLLLVEQQFGWLDAGVFPDKDKFLEMQKTFEAFRKAVGKFYAKPPNGESWFDVTLRTHGFLDKLFRPQWSGKPVVVVSHAVPIATFLYHLAGRDGEETVRMYQENDLDNCGIVHFRHTEDTELHWELVCFNRVEWR